MNNKSVKSNLIIALCICAVTGVFLSFKVFNTKKNLEEYNKALGKDESVSVMQAGQTFLNDNKMGTFEEDVKFGNKGNKTGVIEIKEKMFLSQTNDIYLNSDDYLGKTIKLEGIFKQEEYGGHDYCFVLRYGPGCCGSDGNAGFQVAWNAAANKPYPAGDAWVEAAGVLSTYEEDGSPYLYLDLISLDVLNKRGAEFVRQ